MPIPFTCPHCGKSMLVEDRFAGQSGPCAGCGQSITIPGANALPSQPPASSSNSGCGIAIAIGAGVGIVGLCVIGILVALLLPAVQSARTAARRTQSSNNLRQIGLALHNYHDLYGSFPPPYVADASGKPLYSWRVLILPFMEQVGVYNAFDKTKAWDSPENQAISGMMIETFRSPAEANLALNGCSYRVYVGNNTVFPPNGATNIAQVTDGTANTLMVIEAHGLGGSWAAPIDLDVSTAPTTVGPNPGELPESAPRGTNILLTDGSVRFLMSPDSARVLPLLINRNDGQPIPPY